MKKLILSTMVMMMLMLLSGCLSKQNEARPVISNENAIISKEETLQKFKRFLSEIGNSSKKSLKRGPYLGISYLVREGIYVNVANVILFYPIDNIFKMTDAQLFDILDQFEAVKNNETLKSHFIYDGRALSYKQIEAGIFDFYDNSAKDAYLVLPADIVIREVLANGLEEEKSPDGLAPRLPTLTFTPSDQIFDTPQTVKISNITTGSNVYYTVDGSLPTTSSTIYNDLIGIYLTKTTTICAIAVKSGNTNSLISVKKYEIREKVALPKLSVIGGIYTTAQTIYVSCDTAGVTIRYTTDNSEPTENSTLYLGSITMNTSSTLKVKAFKQDFMVSDTITASYTIMGKLTAPQISKVSGIYATSQSITITCDVVGAEMRYTTDNTEPTINSKLYTGTILITSTSVIKAKAFKSDWISSETSVATITIADLGITFGTSKSTMGFVYYPINVTSLNNNVSQVEVWAIGSVRNVLRTTIMLSALKGSGSIVVPQNISKIYLIGKDSLGNVIVQKQLEITLP